MVTHYLVGKIPVRLDTTPTHDLISVQAFNPLMGGHTTDPIYYHAVIRENMGPVREITPAEYERQVQALRGPTRPAAPTPTIDALARSCTNGDRQAVIRLLDALTTETLRQARIERHAS